MKENIESLCIKYNLGCLQNTPQPVTGGLMHKMYHVVTNQGEYAIKVLNPDIMQRAEALRNMINSEKVSNKLKNTIPLIAAESFQGQNIIELDGSYYMIFHWLDGKSVFPPEISEYHCGQIGSVLGKIHAANISVNGMEKNESGRKAYEWNVLLEKAWEQNLGCCSILKNNLPDIMQWDKCVVSGWEEISRNQVISHRDLDPKNVMWKDNQPYIIDWEAAGYVNPFQELIEVLNYWIVDETGKYDKAKFVAIMQAYTESMDISNVNWEIVLGCSFDGMLGWLEYNLKRALGLEGTGAGDRQEGGKQTVGTMKELQKFAAQIAELKDWINEYVRKKYSI